MDFSAHDNPLIEHLGDVVVLSEGADSGKQEKINARWDEMLKVVTSIKDQLQGSGGATVMVDVEYNRESLVEEDDLIETDVTTAEIASDTAIQTEMDQSATYVEATTEIYRDQSFPDPHIEEIEVKAAMEGEVADMKKVDKDSGLAGLIGKFNMVKLLTVMGGLITDEGAGAFSFVNEWKEHGLSLEFISSYYDIMLMDLIFTALGLVYDDSNNKQWLDGSCKECPVTVAAKVKDIVVAVVVRVGMASVVEKETRIVIVAATDEKTAGNVVQRCNMASPSALMELTDEIITRFSLFLEDKVFYGGVLTTTKWKMQWKSYGKSMAVDGELIMAGKRLDNGKVKGNELEQFPKPTVKMKLVLILFCELLREVDMLGVSRIKVVCQGAHAWGLEQGLRVNASKALPSSTKETMTVRDVLNSALDEEIAPDSKVLVNGEEVRKYHGAYNLTKGLLDKFDPEVRGCWIQPPLRLDFWNTSCCSILQFKACN
ncbi:hypothetical protein SASPL_154291 [Salvia splendens]|uniref:Pyruvate dehydrogenase E1 component subunit beta n=1 Tax=Salvia splendens TaxID=180675 RepID=A0A8X8W0B7_SALSN|nr:hypothetical protein SASPL_154291 [Salvia splendens]